MKQNPKAVLFDLDGTLLDTAPDLGAALNQVLREEGRAEVSNDIYRSYASHGANGLLTLGFGEQDYAADQARLRSAFLAAYSAAIHHHSVLFPGIEEMLSELQQQGYLCAIVTNKPTQLTQQLLPYFAPLNALDVVVCGDTLSVAKPHPQPLLYAAEQLAVEANQCWYVGDAERDILAGRAAGMTTVLAEYGYITPDEVPAQWPADHRIAEPAALTALLRQLTVA